MKSNTKSESLRKKYLRRLLSDNSVDDVMPLFTRAMRIFQLGSKEKRKLTDK